MLIADYCEISKNLLNDFMNVGIYVDYSPIGRNAITCNFIENCASAMYLGRSNENMIFHNCLINSSIPEIFQSERDMWDNGNEGNYWSDYNGTDTNSDGIGDTPYYIDSNNTDHYPLMGMLYTCNTSNGTSITIASNSTVEDFRFFQSNSTIVMHVSNVTSTQEYGFCRLTIPHAILDLPYNIMINGKTVPYKIVLENDTSNTVYFSYEHSTLEIVIVPEYLSSIIQMLAMIVVLFVVRGLARGYSGKKEI